MNVRTTSRPGRGPGGPPFQMSLVFAGCAFPPVSLCVCRVFIFKDTGVRVLARARNVSRHWAPPRACYRVPCCETCGALFPCRPSFYSQKHRLVSLWPRRPGPGSVGDSGPVRYVRHVRVPHEGHNIGHEHLQRVVIVHVIVTVIHHPASLQHTSVPVRRTCGTGRRTRVWPPIIPHCKVLAPTLSPPAPSPAQTHLWS